MARALELAGWKEFPARRRAASKRGLLAGIGLSNYVELPVGMPVEYVRVTVQAGGVVEVVAGTQSTGQGHETTFAQVLADQLGVTPEQVRLVTGDTAGGAATAAAPIRTAPCGSPARCWSSTSERIVAQARAVVAALIGVQVGRRRRSTTASSTRRNRIAGSISSTSRARSRASPRSRPSCTGRSPATRPSSAASRPIRPAARSARSRSIPTPARSRSPAMPRSTTPAAPSTR